MDISSPLTINQSNGHSRTKNITNNIIELKNNNGNSLVHIHLYGATVISWKVDNEEQLFISKKSKWQENTAIQGGIPLVFPQFGVGKMPLHGFARICVWNINKIENDYAILSISNLDLSHDWKQQFPYKFNLEYTIQIMNNNNLYTKLSVQNTESEQDGQSFQFTAGFHTYFKVHSKSVEIIGLKGLNFIDTLDKNKIKQEENERVRIESETDWVYMDINDKDIILIDETKQKYPIIRIKKNGFADVVLWNPWIATSKKMDDFDNNEYKQMVCIEPASFVKPVRLLPTQSKLYKQILIPSKL
eukprot:92511_1